MGVETRGGAAAPSGQAARVASVEELTEGARMARLAMGCYRNFESVAKEEGLFCVAEGLTTYTRWCIADEIEAGKVVRRVVMVRGVELRSGQDNSIDRMGLWAKLAQCWPEPFETAWNPDSPLVVHRGIAEVAEGVWDDIQAYVKHRPPTAQLTFGGHSLGGAVGLLLMCYCRTRLSLPPAALAPAFTFGAPACLAVDAGVSIPSRGLLLNAAPPLPSAVASPSAASSSPTSDVYAAPRALDALAALDLGPDHVRHFVQGLDVIPRCFLSTDPTWSTILKLPFVKEALQLRSQLLGGSLLSAERFLYEMQGLVYLMEWNRARGTAVKVVAGGAADAALALGPALAADVLARKPMLAAQSLLDHSSQNYAWELSNIAEAHERKVNTGVL